MIVNHLEKLFVTNDAATIIRELEVVHPAAKLLVMASQQQESEVGDATNFVLVFAGELLEKAAYLLRMGLHPSEVVQGYELARDKALAILEGIYHYIFCGIFFQFSFFFFWSNANLLGTM
jgi:T-complex protein 1 subunit theta